MRVLITGATGFVGSHLADAFAAAGHQLRCTVRERSDPRWIAPLEPELVGLDLGRPDADYRAAVEGMETVVHAGGITRARDESEYRRINADATERLAAAASATGVRTFVYVSSLAARGPDDHPAPVHPYGESKREGERRLEGVSGAMEIVVLRPAGVYGPRDSDFLALFRMARRGWLPAPAGGAPFQPVFVEDVATAVLRASRGGIPDVPYPVAEPRRYSWPELVELLATAIGRTVRTVRLPARVFEAAGLISELVAGLARRAPDLDRRRARDLTRYAYTCDTAETERVLGWEAAVSLPEGLERTARWYREVGWL